MPETDTSFRVQTPEGIEYSLYPAGLPIRLFAYGIDTVFQTIVLLCLVFLYFALFDRMIGIWLILLARFVIDWFYYVLWEVFCRGQSPGKRFLGIRVIKNDGSPVDIGSSFVRNLLRFADGFLGLYFIVFITVITSKAFRRPGDWAAGTLVIYTWQSQVPERQNRMSWLDSVPPASPCRELTPEEKQGLLMFARRYPVLGPARADEIARPMAASLRGAENPGAVPGAAGSDANYLLGIARTFAGDYAETPLAAGRFAANEGLA
ncbi:MAG: RDD family protein [Treponema sp.]|jgi:uncharacterized RDD family membrane protein YckC|nr:RDD family protein [Treponema sp.]